MLGLTVGAFADLTIVKEGKPNARIVVGNDSTHISRYAAKELSDFVEKSTGAELEIVDQLGTDGLVNIVVGPGRIADSLGVTTEGLTRDANRFVAKDNHIVILGIDDKKQDIAYKLTRYSVWCMTYEIGTLFGVYEFLETFIGIRWYMHMPIGEVVPKFPTLTIPEYDHVDTPRKLGRHVGMYKSLETIQEQKDNKYSLSYGGFGRTFRSGEERVHLRNTFAARLRHNTVAVRIHTMHQLVSPKTYLESHPEYFALDGKGGRIVKGAHTQHCFSQEAMIDKIARDAEAFFKGEDAKPRGFRAWGYVAYESPWGKAFHLLQGDGWKPCHCGACKKATDNAVDRGLSYKELNAAYAPQLWNAWIKIANHVKKVDPDGIVIVYVYGPTKTFPKNIEKLPDNMALELAHSGPYQEYDEKTAVKQHEEVKRWASLLTSPQRMRMHTYVTRIRYNDRYRRRLPRAIVGSIPRTIAKYAKRYRDLGYGNYMYEGHHSIAYEHINDYFYYKFLWNPDLDPETVLQEYYDKFYGPASGPMGEFWNETERQFWDTRSITVETPMGPEVRVRSWKDLWDNVYSEDTIDRWGEYFEEALVLAKPDKDPAYLERVEFMKANVYDFIAAERDDFYNGDGGKRERK